MNAPEQVVSHVLKNYRKGSGFTVLISPIVWDVPRGSDMRQWYFVIASGRISRDTGRGRDFTLDRVTVEGGEQFAVEARKQFLTAVAARTEPLIVHTFDDELDMAEWLAGIWPGERSRGLVRSIRNERAATD